MGSDEQNEQLTRLQRAANPSNLALLRRADWFRASEVAQETGADRTLVRRTARELAALRLLDEREVLGASRQTFEWRVSPDGERVAEIIDEWLGVARQSTPSPPRYLGLFAVTSHQPLGGELTTELITRLARSRVSQLVPAVVFEEDSDAS